MFLRLEGPGLPAFAGDVFLVEVTRDGKIAREVGLRADGSPVYFARQGDVSVWSGLGPTAPPGSPEFERNWGPAVHLARQEFEDAYALAEKTLPPPSRWHDIRLGRGVTVRFAAWALVLGLVVFVLVTLLTRGG